ncbi:outer membrane beta-barrel protein [Sediminitomix flava]|uniref:Outer membrane protein with beta-barrel domain n=1 Tax=Sediminitomix flava TaxID=379075 RepID=A0A315ZWS4_SEDFL|nr:outer membrane beta-barrel protein [Sediminitomix flava]PWJ41777.1 outer membrane protein with beta-barrel domain [Sediminitomix flava]
MNLRTLILSLFCFTMWTTSMAQEKQSPFTFGLKGGMNTSAILVANPDDGGFLFGGFGGLYSNYKINDRWAIQAEIQYGQHGVFGLLDMYESMYASDLDPDLDDDKFSVELDGRLNIRTEYLSIPLVVQYAMGKNKNWALEGGVIVGFLSRTKINYNGSAIYREYLDNGSIDTEIDITDDINALVNQTKFKTIDMSFALGLQYAIPNSNFHIGGRTIFGLNNINTSTVENSWMRNLNLQLGVGYSF